MDGHRAGLVIPPALWTELHSRLPPPGGGNAPALVPFGRQLHRFETTTGPYLLKEHGFLGEDRLSVFAATLDLLVEAGIHPPVVRFSDGRGFAVAQGRTFTVMPLLSTLPFETKRDLDAAAAVIARMHAIMASVDAEPTRSPMWAETEQVTAELTGLGRRDLARTVEDARLAWPRVRVQLVHNDLHAGNLFRANARIYVTDLESLSTNPLPGDVFFAALRFGDGGADAAARFVAAYRAAAPLSNDEVDLGPLMLLADLAGKLAFIHRRLAAGDRRLESDIPKYLDLIERAQALGTYLARTMS